MTAYLEPLENFPQVIALKDLEDSSILMLFVCD